MVLISIPTTVSQGTAVTTFATCVDTNSTVLLEFQGVVEMDGTSWAGNPLGQLSIMDGGVKAQLVIGNHRLDGKVVKLDKPMLLIQKQHKAQEIAEQEQPSTGASRGKVRSSDYGLDDDPRNRRSSFSSLPPSSPPARHDEDDTMTSTGWGDESVANTNAAAADADAMTLACMRDTIQYDTVAIIRQKILFNTMPVPIIHMERRGLTVIKRGV